MLRTIITFCAFLLWANIFSQNFTTRWNTNLPSSPSNEITIPTNPSYTYNYTVDWGDGNTDNTVTGDITHVYASPGIYTVQISGTFPAIYFNNTGDRQKIIEITDWGTIQWQTMEDAFFGCANLNFDAISAPDLSQVTSLKNAFRSCSSFNGILNNWNVSNVTDISGLFASCSIFNRPLDLWNTISVTTMEETFYSANNFNEPLDNWNTASVTTMRFMFSNASSFNQNINNWDVSNVTNMSGTFRYTGSFNQPLNNWNVGNVTDMSSMFDGSDFNQPINNWNVDNVTNMSEMFRHGVFNQPIESWNVSQVTDMSEMFQRHRTFNQPLNNWNVSNVTDMSSMFDGWIWGAVFNQPLDNWNVSSVTDMSYMFRDNSGFNQDISGWNVSNVTDMQGMFEETTVFNQDISSWDVGNVENMSSMFQLATAFNQPLNIWNVVNVTNMSGMFYRSPAFNQPLDNWNVANVTSLQNMFGQATAFDQDISGWNTSSVTNMTGTFNQATSFNQNIGNWNISSVTNMSNMLSNSGISQENYDNILIAWAGQTVNPNINLGANNLQYCDGLTQRQSLIDDDGWTISGDSVNCSYVLCTEITMPLAGDTQVPANSDIRWDPAPNATGYYVTLEIERGGVRNYVTIDGNVANNYDVGNVVGLDFTNEFITGDTVFITVVPYNGEGPATGCSEINFTVVDSWVNSPDAFKLTYDTNLQESGQSTPIDQLKIQTRSGLTYDFSIDWGDGQYNNNVTGDITHTYLNPGVYTISIIGMFPAPRHEEFNSDSIKLIYIEQWGTQVWESMQGAFAGCENMEYNATDVPDLTNVTDMSRTFIACYNFNGNINTWNVGNVTNMYGLFGAASIFNQPLDNWDVSNVTNMNFMFASTNDFNQDISSWNTSSVTDMGRMFRYAASFNQPLNSWNVSNVQDMNEMFQRANSFNQPLDNWNVSSVTDMEEMFDSAAVFNQNIDSWDVSSVTTMQEMFYSTPQFNQPLNSWDVSSVTNMASMFYDTPVFDQPLSNWDVSEVTTMRSMFSNSSVFNQNIDSWNVTNVTDMSYMFNYADTFNQPLNSWDVNSVVNMSGMFRGAAVFNQPLNNWNVSAVANMSFMFEDAIVFDQPINTWDISSVTLMESMFEDAVAFNQELNNWNVSVVTNFQSMFQNAALFNSPLSNWNTGEALTMAEMFRGAAAFNQAIDSWNVSFVTTMQEMFRDAISFDQELNPWNVASVTTMRGMFQNATSFNSGINDWNVRGVITMENMFYGATSFNQSINDWRVNGVANMNGMFQNAIAFNQAFHLWSPGSVSMRNMFNGASAFDQYLGYWNIENVTDMQNMLDNTIVSRENYDNTLIDWSEQTLTAGITFGALGLPYCDALQERQHMIDTYGWNIVGDILDCPVPECTQLVSPANGETDVPVNTNLTWDHALYSDSYDLTITIMPSGTVLNETVTETSYQFANGVLSLGDTVSVLITPVNGTGSAVGCTTESFDISSIPATVPDCTTLSLPLANAVDVVIDTDLEWNPISNADGYRLTVGTSSGGNDILNDIDVGNVTVYDFTTDLPEDIDIFVTIVPYNEEGYAAACAEESFTTELIPVPPVCTTLSDPIDGTTNVPVDTNISWNAVTDATGYLVIVGETQGGIEVANNIDVGNVTSYTFPADLQENRTHYVTIIPYNAVGDAIGCDEESFRTGNSTLNDPPGCTSLTTPTNSATDVAVDTDLIWVATANTDGYRLTVGTSSGGNDILDNVDVGNVITYDLPTDLPENTTVFITIVPYNSFGDATGCTEESFVTETLATAPSCTTLTNPTNGTSDVSITTDLSWNNISNADGYRLTVGTTSGGNDILDNVDVGNVITYDLPIDLPESTDIFVTIVPYNGIGDAMGCSEESFTTETLATIPSCTTLTNPLNGAINVSIITDLAWNSISNADGYRLTVGTTSGGNDILDNADVGNVTTYDLPTDLPEDMNIFVTIVPYNGVGDATVCIEESFATETLGTIPNCTSLADPTNTQSSVPVDSDINWNAITNADGYRLTVGTTSGGNDILDDVDVGNVTMYDFTNDLPENSQVFVTITPYNAMGGATGCAEESFNTEIFTTVPGCTSLASPTDMDIDVSVSTDLTWNTVIDATGYRLTVGTVTGGNDIVDDLDVGFLTTYDLPTGLPENTEIFVTVVPYNTVGDATACAEESFITGAIPSEPPACTSLSTPEATSFNIPVTTGISWSDVDGVDGYYITIGTTEGGNDIVDNLDVGQTTQYQPTEDLPFEQQIFVTITPYADTMLAENCGSQSFATEEEPQAESLYGFSPDGDGVNDFWTINGIENYLNNTVTIFNRWGDKVFEITGYDNASNVFRGEANQLTGMGAGQLPEGTYFFQINIPEQHNLRTTKGFLVLKR